MVGGKQEMKLIEAIQDALDIILKNDPTVSKWSNRYKSVATRK